MCKKINPHLKVASILPSPSPTNFGGPTLTLYAPDAVDLQGWHVRDVSGNLFPLNGAIRVGQGNKFHIPKNTLSFHNNVNALYLVNKTGHNVHMITFKKRMLNHSQHMTFPPPNFSHNDDAAQISAIIADPSGENLIVTIKALFVPPVHLTGWKLKDKEDNIFRFKGHLQPGLKKTVQLKKDSFKLNNKGDQLSLIDPFGTLVHQITYEQNEIKRGSQVEFVPPSVTNCPILMAAPTISRLERDRQNHIIATVQVRGSKFDLSGYKLIDSYNNTNMIEECILKPGRKQQFMMDGNMNSPPLDKDYTIILIDSYGVIVHCLSQPHADIKKGVILDQSNTNQANSETADNNGDDKESFSAPWGSFYKGDDGIYRKKQTSKFKKACCSLLCLSGCLKAFCCCCFCYRKEIHEASSSGMDSHSHSHSRRHTSALMCCWFIRCPKPAPEPKIQGPQESPKIWLSSIQADPIDGNRKIILLNTREDVSNLEGWKLMDEAGHFLSLEGSVNQQHPKTLYISNDTFSISGQGDKLSLMDTGDVVVHTILLGVGAGTGYGSIRSSFTGIASGIGTKTTSLVVISCITLAIAEGKQEEEKQISVTLTGNGEKDIDLTGWKLQNRAEHKFDLEGTIEPEKERTFFTSTTTLPMNNNGDKLSLIDASGEVAHVVRYKARDVKPGVPLLFNPLGRLISRTPIVSIVSMLPTPMGTGKEAWETVTLQINKSSVDLAGWKLKDHTGYSMNLEGLLKEKQRISFFMKKESITINETENQIWLIDSSGRIIHTVTYTKSDLSAGGAIDFDESSSIDKVSVGQPRIPTVLISSILPYPDLSRAKAMVQIKVLGGNVDLKGYKLMNTNSDEYNFDSCSIEEGKITTIFINSSTFSFSQESDIVTLLNQKGHEIHRVIYNQQDVKQGVAIDFGSNTNIPMAGIARTPTVQLSSIMSNPYHNNSSQRMVTVKAIGSDANLDDWKMIDRHGYQFVLTGMLEDGYERSYITSEDGRDFGSDGDSITLFNASGEEMDCVHFEKEQNKSSVMIDFTSISNGMIVGKARLPTVLIASLLPHFDESEDSNGYVTLKVEGDDANLYGYKIQNQNGQIYEIESCTVKIGCEKTFAIKYGLMSLRKEGDILKLLNMEGYQVHCVQYTSEVVHTGKWIDFGFNAENALIGTLRTSGVSIVSVLHTSLGEESTQMMITLQSKHVNVNVDNWRLEDLFGQMLKLNGTLKGGCYKSFLFDTEHLEDNNEIILYNDENEEIDRIGFHGGDVYSGMMIDFKNRKENMIRGKPRILQLTSLDHSASFHTYSFEPTTEIEEIEVSTSSYRTNAIIA